MPDGLREIEAAQREVWQRFARTLPKGARLLDLATGDGCILKKMLEVRTDLHLTGVDSAPTLPPPPRGIALRAGVAMEELPFQRASFDAITSQFGYEYGHTASVAAEAGRLLRPEGKLLLILHHRDGPIVAHNLPRRDALRWALSPGGPMAKARAFLAARRIAPLPTPAAFRAAAEEVQRLFPAQSVGAEFLQAICQTLDLGRFKPVSETIEVLDTLEQKAGNEIARIETLERAACDAARIETISCELRDANLEIAPPGVVSERSSGRDFGWLVSGTRRD